MWKRWLQPGKYDPQNLSLDSWLYTDIQISA